MAEHRPFKPGVVGSIPTTLTIFKLTILLILFKLTNFITHDTMSYSYSRSELSQKGVSMGIEKSYKILVGTILQEKGYVLANRVGQEISALTNGSFPELGVLKEKEKKNFLEKLFNCPKEFLGVLKFYDVPEKPIKFHFHGSSNTKEVNALAEEIESKVNVKVHLILTSEDRLREPIPMV